MPLDREMGMKVYRRPALRNPKCVCIALSHKRFLGRVVSVHVVALAPCRNGRRSSRQRNNTIDAVQALSGDLVQGTYAVGDAVSMADETALNGLYWLGLVSVETPLELNHSANWRESAAARPAFAAARW